MALGVEQVEALLEKNRALVARERERVNEQKAHNEDTLQEICASLIVPTSAFGMSYARAYFGEKASIAGIAIDSFVGLLMHAVGACFGLSESKGGQRVGKFFQDIANGALASWTAALGAEYGAKKRLETPTPRPTVGAVGLAQGSSVRTAGPMTHDDLAAIKAAMSTPAPPAPTPNVSAVGSVQGTPTPVSMPMDYGHLAAITAAMLTPPPMPQQRATAPVQPAPQAPEMQPARSATQAAPPTPTPGAQPTPSSTPKKGYRFTQARAAPLPDLGAAFACGTYPMREVDKNLQWLSQRYNSESLASILKWAAAP